VGIRSRTQGRRTSRALGGGLALAAAVVACAVDQPPMAGSSWPIADAGADREDATPDFHFEAGPHPCNLGNGTYCTCSDTKVLADVPNVYLILDRSGSMSQTAPNAPPQAPSKWSTVVTVVAHAISALGPRIDVGAAVFPDPMVDPNVNACAVGRERVSVRPGDTPAGSMTGPTYKAIVSDLLTLSPGGGTPTAATLQSLLPGLKSLSGRTYVILATDGGPNCDTNATCDVTECILNIEASASGCYPNQLPNCCDSAHYGGASCLDSAPTIAAVSAYADANIPVYVIGVPGSGPYSALLDQLAQAGKTARAASPFYYRVDGYDEASFQAALFQVAAKIVASCTLKLEAPPADPGLLNVFLDGTVVPQAGADGWTLDASTITLLGASCDKVLSGQVLDVNVSGGCPTVVR
jgi:hypothetical protein